MTILTGETLARLNAGVAIPRYDRRKVGSTTGAGDAFAAGAILGPHEGWPVERCLRLAVASAAASVRSPNTSDGIKPAGQCLAEADRAGYRPTPPVQRVY